MAQRDKTGRPTKELLERAAATSLDSARIITRSIALVMRSIELTQSVASACETAGVTRTKLLRAQLPRNKPAGEQSADGRVSQLRAARPLTRSRLLELAEEFRCLANRAATPHSKAAFQDLMFRYTALASGFDDERVGSRMLH